MYTYVHHVSNTVAELAQLVEPYPAEWEVTGSTPRTRQTLSIYKYTHCVTEK